VKAPRFSNLAVDTKADALTDLLNGGTLAIFAGPKPATADEPTSEEHTLLAVLGFAPCAFKSAINGRAEAEAITPCPSARAAGKPEWFRAYTPEMLGVFDGTVGPEGDGKTYDLYLDCKDGKIEFDSVVGVDSFYYVEAKR